MQQKSLEPPTELQLRPGASSRIRLGGAGSAGYQWMWTVDGDPKCISVAVEAAPMPVAKDQLHSGELHSGSIDQIIVVRALHKGAVVLHLKLARSFQPSHRPLAAYDIAVTVSG